MRFQNPFERLRKKTPQKTNGREKIIVAQAARLEEEIKRREEARRRLKYIKGEIKALPGVITDLKERFDKNDKDIALKDNIAFNEKLLEKYTIELEIIDLEEEIAQREVQIATIPNELERDIKENTLNSRRGLLEIRRDQLKKLNQ